MVRGRGLEMWGLGDLVPLIGMNGELQRIVELIIWEEAVMEYSVASAPQVWMSCGTNVESWGAIKHTLYRFDRIDRECKHVDLSHSGLACYTRYMSSVYFNVIICVWSQRFYYFSYLINDLLRKFIYKKNTANNSTFWRIFEVKHLILNVRTYNFLSAFHINTIANAKLIFDETPSWLSYWFNLSIYICHFDTNRRFAVPSRVCSQYVFNDIVRKDNWDEGLSIHGWDLAVFGQAGCVYYVSSTGIGIVERYFIIGCITNMKSGDKRRYRLSGYSQHRESTTVGYLPQNMTLESKELLKRYIRSRVADYLESRLIA